MNTPIPIHIKSHRGVKNNSVVKQYNIPLVKTSLRTWELPEEAITVTGNAFNIQYRYNYNARSTSYGGHSQYASISAYGPNYSKFEYSGCTMDFDTHLKLMETFRICHHIISPIFAPLSQ